MFFFAVWILLSKAMLTSTGGTCVLRFVRYSNPGYKDDVGQCCESTSSSGCNPNQCDPYLNICIGDYPKTTECNHGRTTTQTYDNTDTIQFQSTVGSLSNPIIFTFEKWQGGLSFSIRVVDKDNLFGDDLIEDFTYNLAGIIPRPNGFTQPATPERISGKRVVMDIEHSVYCEDNYYGDCSIYCKPDPDRYSCDFKSGRKLCFMGWTGPNCDVDINECTVVTCMNGARCIDGINSYRCICTYEYTGKHCEVKIPSTTTKNSLKLSAIKNSSPETKTTSSTTSIQSRTDIFNKDTKTTITDTFLSLEFTELDTITTETNELPKYTETIATEPDKSPQYTETIMTGTNKSPQYTETIMTKANESPKYTDNVETIPYSPFNDVSYSEPYMTTSYPSVEEISVDTHTQMNENMLTDEEKMSTHKSTVEVEVDTIDKTTFEEKSTGTIFPFTDKMSTRSTSGVSNKEYEQPSVTDNNPSTPHETDVAHQATSSEEVSDSLSSTSSGLDPSTSTSSSYPFYDNQTVSSEQISDIQTTASEEAPDNLTSSTQPSVSKQPTSPSGIPKTPESLVADVPTTTTEPVSDILTTSSERVTDIAKMASVQVSDIPKSSSEPVSSILTSSSELASGIPTSSSEPVSNYQTSSLFQHPAVTTTFINTRTVPQLDTSTVSDLSTSHLNKMSSEEVSVDVINPASSETTLEPYPSHEQDTGVQTPLSASSAPMDSHNETFQNLTSTHSIQIDNETAITTNGTKSTISIILSSIMFMSTRTKSTIIPSSATPMIPVFSGTSVKYSKLLSADRLNVDDTGSVIGAVLGALYLAVLLIIAFILIRRKYKERLKVEHSSDSLQDCHVAENVIKASNTRNNTKHSQVTAGAIEIVTIATESNADDDDEHFSSEV